MTDDRVVWIWAKEPRDESRRSPLDDMSWPRSNRSSRGLMICFVVVWFAGAVPLAIAQSSTIPGVDHLLGIGLAPADSSLADSAAGSCTSFTAELVPFDGALQLVIGRDDSNNPATLCFFYGVQDSAAPELPIAGSSDGVNGHVALYEGALIDFTGRVMASSMLVTTVAAPDGTSFSIGSSLSAGAAANASLLLNRAIAISFVQDGMVPAGQGSPGEISLGSSCSCPACSNGVMFSPSFFVIGVGYSRGGIACCGTACNIACALLLAGRSTRDAWILGQGQWVLCMLCQ